MDSKRLHQRQTLSSLWQVPHSDNEPLWRNSRMLKPGHARAKLERLLPQTNREGQKILGVGSSAFWSPLLFLAALIRPSLSLLPVGPIGSRHWAARNAIFAAQTLMLGAAAKGIDSCPMEGFSASKVAKLLGLSRGSVIPIVVALGYRADDARIEERWRRPMTDVVVSY